MSMRVTRSRNFKIRWTSSSENNFQREKKSKSFRRLAFGGVKKELRKLCKQLGASLLGDIRNSMNFKQFFYVSRFFRLKRERERSPLSLEDENTHSSPGWQGKLSALNFLHLQVNFLVSST